LKLNYYRLFIIFLWRYLYFFKNKLLWEQRPLLERQNTVYVQKNQDLKRATQDEEDENEQEEEATEIKPVKKINYIKFNQDSSLFSFATEHGFHIHQVANKKEMFVNQTLGPLKITSILTRSNIVALVGTEENTKITNQQIIIWDMCNWNKKNLIKKFIFSKIRYY
jgi:hypothetical protein